MAMHGAGVTSEATETAKATLPGAGLVRCEDQRWFIDGPGSASGCVPRCRRWRGACPKRNGCSSVADRPMSWRQSSIGWGTGFSSNPEPFDRGAISGRFVGEPPTKASKFVGGNRTNPADLCSVCANKTGTVCWPIGSNGSVVCWRNANKDRSRGGDRGEFGSRARTDRVVGFEMKVGHVRGHGRPRFPCRLSDGQPSRRGGPSRGPRSLGAQRGRVRGQAGRRDGGHRPRGDGVRWHPVLRGPGPQDRFAHPRR